MATPLRWIDGQSEFVIMDESLAEGLALQPELLALEGGPGSEE